MFGVLSHIPERKNRVSFLKMFNELVTIEGSIKKVLTKYHIGNNTYDRLKDDRYLSVNTAHKILDAYKAMKLKLASDDCAE